MEITVGADPEVFLSEGGKIISAYGKIPGDKTHPHRVNGGAVQVDGMALEFNIDPVSDEDSFLGNINRVMSQLAAMVPQGTLEIIPTAYFSKKYMAEQPEESKILGCDPDFNAWLEGSVNDPPDGSHNFRTGAGHVHIGYPIDTKDYVKHLSSCISVTKQMDCTLGLMSLLYDEDTKRREMYGKAGAFRMKPYGVEYRTLSNAWLSSEHLIRWVFKTTKLAMDRLQDRVFLWKEIEDVESIINTSDKNSKSFKNALSKLLEYGFSNPLEV